MCMRRSHSFCTHSLFVHRKKRHELLEQKREILVMELMHMVERVKLLEQKIDELIEKAYPALKKMLMQFGGDRVEQMSSGVKYDFSIIEKSITIGGMRFPTIDVKLPEKKLQSYMQKGLRAAVFMML